jgi:hypothetical protein
MSTHKFTVKWDLDTVEIPDPEPGAENLPRVRCPHCGIFTLWRREPLPCNDHLIERAAAQLAKDIDRQILEELLNDPSIRKANPRGV